MNAYYVCATQTERDLVSATHFEELTNIWTKTVFGHLLSYATYRIETFSIFLIVPEDHLYAWQNGTDPNELSQTVKSERAQNILKTYTLDFGCRNFPILYQTWFWLVAAAVIFRFSQKSKRYRKMTQALILSAIIYIVSYIPVVVATDYRYIYWPVLAILIAAVLLISERYPTQIKSSERQRVGFRTTIL